MEKHRHLNYAPPKLYPPSKVAALRFQMEGQEFIRFKKDCGTPVNGPVNTVVETWALRFNDRILLVPEFHSTRSPRDAQICWQASRPISVIVAGFSMEQVEIGFIKAVFDKWDNEREAFLTMYPQAAEGSAKGPLPLRIKEIPDWAQEKLTLTYYP